MNNIVDIKKINIQIILFNSIEKVENLFKSISLANTQNFELQFHILIHDNKEISEYKSVIEKSYNQNNITYDKNENVGFGCGHNLIYNKYKHLYSEFFMILNPDTFFFFDTFEYLYKFINKYTNSKVGAIELHQFPFEHPKPYNPNTFETDWFSGAAVLIRTKLFEELKGFDPNYFMYYEDTDLSYRVRLAGYKILHVPSARVIHQIGGSSEEKDHSKSKFYLVHMRAGNLYFMKKFSIHDKNTENWILNNSEYKDDVQKQYKKMTQNGQPIHPTNLFFKKQYDKKRW